ncbi:hypothetical protein H2200_010261 [Cladophialophora chaetospira]|uniref:AB hydrolase-1 domain-containing protein n=1 Tax=Cladophialophora chaetospira TaxID=386627 RepID=A0AA38X2J9_9EURO|nr:hypothetical protein H2200_010261 [Cladophialophora chaetospira]
MLKLSALQLLLSTYLCGQAVFASPTSHPSAGKQQSPSWAAALGATCAKFNVAVPAKGNNVVAEGPRVDNNIDAVTFMWDADTWSHPNSTVRITGTIPVDQTFNIVAQLCVPSSGDKSEILQIATHGAGFDRRYWDVELEPENYSYVRAAIKAGYSILTYDRLGVGESDKPDAYTMVQAPIQLEILQQISLMARSGKISQLAQAQITSGVTLPKFSKFVHVGHSYGSILTSALLAKYPDSTDGAILTGFVLSPQTSKFSQSARGYQFAKELDPVKWADRGSGYITNGALYSFHTHFLAGGTFDPKLLEYGFDVRQPTTVGESRSSIAIYGLPAHNFTKPLQLFLAENDNPVCDGDCKGAYNLTQIRAALYPNAAVLEDYIQPATAHGFTLQKNATAGYQVMFDFFGRNGL